MKPELKDWFNGDGANLEKQFCRSLERCIHHANAHGISYKDMDIGRLMFYFHKDMIDVDEMLLEQVEEHA